MNYFDNVDYEKLLEQAYELAFEEAFNLFLEGKLEDNEIATYVKLTLKAHCDHIWLMGPVPMKEGYKPPVSNFSFLDYI